MTTMKNTSMGTPNTPVDALGWQLMGAVTLASRLVLGWVYWGGASRRFIYATQKIDPTSPGYLANKLVHAAPGAAFGMESILHWLLGLPLLLQLAVIFFSLVELVVGVGLIIGLATRVLSLVGVGLAVTLMLIFGWMGTTCLDEWTMAASGFAMACVTMVAGSGPWAVDNVLQRRGLMSRHPWLSWMTSGPLPLDAGQVRRVSGVLGGLSLVFTVFFYGYNFDAIYSPLGKRVDAARPAIALSQPVLGPHGLTVQAYENAGPDTQGLYIVRAVLAPAAPGATPVFDYDAKALAQKGFVKIVNRYAPWSSCKAIAHGLRCQLGSMAALTFPLPAAAPVKTGPMALTLTDVEGRSFSVALN